MNHYCEEEYRIYQDLSDSNTMQPFFSQYDLVPVYSCFGGMAIYKTEKFLSCRYDPSVYDCEHVPLHKCMREKGSEGRMFMDPLLTTSYDGRLSLSCRRSASAGH